MNERLFESICIEKKDSTIILKITNTHQGLEPQVDLGVALSRPPTCKKVLEHGTSLGVGHFHFFQTNLTEKSYAKSKIFEKNKIEALLKLGLSQSNIFYELPKVSIHRDYSSLNQHKGLFLSLKSKRTFGDYGEQLKNGRPLLLIGPERGWTEQEEHELEENGHRPVNIGPSTLRVEIATFVALGQLQYCLRDRLQHKLVTPPYSS